MNPNKGHHWDVEERNKELISSVPSSFLTVLIVKEIEKCRQIEKGLGSPIDEKLEIF